MRSFTVISMMFMMTIPPTTMPIATTAGMAVKSRLVSCFQNATKASALSTVKSFSSPGRSRWAIRIASSARAMAPSMASALGHLDRDHGRLPPAVDRLEGAERQQDEGVERLAQQPALLRDHALHRAPRARRAAPACRRRSAGSSNSLSAISWPSADDRPPLADVRLGERRAGEEGVVLHHLVRRA